MRKTALLFGSLFGFLAVALGAFGAHGLESMLIANGRVATWQTAVLYQFVHALLLLILAVLMGDTQSKLAKTAVFASIAGIIVFSGSLYVLSLTNILWLGAITPIGGTAFLLSWASLIYYSIKSVPESK